MDVNSLVDSVVQTAQDTGLNPFNGLAVFLHELMFPPTPPAFKRQIEIAYPLLAAQLAAFSVSIGFRVFRTKDFWIFRLTRRARGTYITPNFSISWQLGMILLLILFQPWCQAILRNIDGQQVPGYFAWLSFIWLGCLFTAWIALWALCVIDALGCGSNDRRTISNPYFMNLAFPAGVLILTSAIAYVGTVGSLRFDRMMEDFAALEFSLYGLATHYSDLSTPAAQAALQSLLPAAQEAFNEFDEFLDFFRLNWIVWATVIAFLCALFIAACLRQYLSLRQAFASVDSQRDSRASRPVAVQSMKAAILNLHLTSAVVTCICVYLLAISIYMAARPTQAATSSISEQVELLSVVYVVNIFGSLGAILAILRAFQATPSEDESASEGSKEAMKRLANQVHVTVTSMVVAETDRALDETIFELKLRQNDEYRLKDTYKALQF